MFEDLKAELATIESKLRTALAMLEGRVGSIEADIQTLDAPLQGAFDKFDASIAEAQGAVTDRVQAILARTAGLRP